MTEVDITIPIAFSDLLPLYNLPTGSIAVDLEAEIRYWFNQTLVNDGFENLQYTVTIYVDSTRIKLTAGGAELPPNSEKYAIVLPKFLGIGLTAYTTAVPKIKAEGKWDPDPANKIPWEFFLPHGLPMVNFRTVQFFHYPPMRLLKLRSYLQDPVPVRWGELIEQAIGKSIDTNIYQRFLDAVPIAANDDQGAYMPITYFETYQKQMLELFLGINPPSNDTTVPVLVFGIPAMAQFEHIFHANLDILVPQLAKEIIENHNTPCLGATHPYHFYAQAQIDVGRDQTIGDGKMGRGCQLAHVLMQQDLIAAKWQVLMAENPEASVGDTLFEATSYALGDPLKTAVCGLTRHQGSLQYPENYEETYEFSFNIGYPMPAIMLCQGDGIDPCS